MVLVIINLLLVLIVVVVVKVVVIFVIFHRREEQLLATRSPLAHIRCPLAPDIKPLCGGTAQNFKLRVRTAYGRAGPGNGGSAAGVVMMNAMEGVVKTRMIGRLRVGMHAHTNDVPLLARALQLP